MCDPADHPAGRYAKASLQTLGLWDSVAAKIAIVENPQVAVAMVARGEAPAAVVFATDAKGVAGASVLGSFPEASHPPIVYPAALTMAAPHEYAAEHLLTRLRARRCARCSMGMATVEPWRGLGSGHRKSRLCRPLSRPAWR